MDERQLNPLDYETPKLEKTSGSSGCGLLLLQILVAIVVLPIGVMLFAIIFSRYSPVEIIPFLAFATGALIWCRGKWK